MSRLGRWGLFFGVFSLDFADDLLPFLFFFLFLFFESVLLDLVELFGIDRFELSVAFEAAGGRGRLD